MSAVEDELANARRKAERDLWRSHLRKQGDAYRGDEANVLVALRAAPELVGLVRFNEFSQNVELTRAPPWREAVPGSPWLESDDTALQAWLQMQELNVRGRATVADTVLLAAQDHAYHPVRQYLESLTWDGEPRLQIWLQDYLNAAGDGPYLPTIGRKFMLSAVARILSPGCQVDHMLVLEGAQGVGKTSAARALAVEPSWFAGSLPDIHSKDAALQLVGRWVVEIAELKAVRNSQLEAIKSFITETADTFRPPYGRRTAQFPRQCVFIATTNEHEYLRDRTGNRRYWPVRCGRVRVEALIRDRDQLWAEAVHEYRAGATWHLDENETALATMEQQERVHLTELEADVAEYLANRRGDKVAVQDVLVYALHLDRAAPGYAESAKRLGTAVADAMQRAGWRRVQRTRQGGDRRTLYAWAGQGGQGI